MAYQGKVQMRRTWLGVLTMAMAIGGWRCAVDNRTPNEVVAPEMPAGSGSDIADIARSGNVPNGAAGSGAGAQTGGAAGSGATGSIGMGSGGTDSGTAGAGPASGGTDSGMAGSGSAGSTAIGGSAGSAGSAMTGNSAGSTGVTPPPGAGGAPPAGSTPNSSTCPSFDACGGTLEGTWTYTNVCIGPSENGGDLLAEACPTGSVMYERGGTSTLTFTSSSVSRTGQPVGDSVIDFPADCTQGLGCSLLAGLLGTAADCTDMGSDCICRSPTSVDWGTQSYSVNGGSLTLGNGRTFDYCVQGNTLTYRETGDLQEAGLNTLQRN